MKHKKMRGFTLIELLVVMAIIATLLTISAPRYLESVDQAKEATLKSNLAQLRDVLDQFNSDRGQYPNSLGELVEKKYLRSIPIDPMTGSSETWRTFPPPGDVQDAGQIYNVRSGSSGTSRSGEPYEKW